MDTRKQLEHSDIETDHEEWQTPQRLIKTTITLHHQHMDENYYTRLRDEDENKDEDETTIEDTLVMEGSDGSEIKDFK